MVAVNFKNNLRFAGTRISANEGENLQIADDFVLRFNPSGTNQA
jgi:hypothetical protein